MKYDYFCRELTNAFMVNDEVCIDIKGENFDTWYDLISPEITVNELSTTIDFDEGVYTFTPSSIFAIDETENVVSFSINDHHVTTKITFAKEMPWQKQEKSNVYTT